MLISQTPEEINLANAIFNQCAFESVNLTKCSAFSSENAKLIDPFKMSLKETESVSKGIIDNRLSVDAKFIDFPPPLPLLRINLNPAVRG